MARHYRVISCDGHLEMPPDLWVRRLPEHYRDRAPRLVRLPEGGEGWLVEDMPLIHNGSNIAAGRQMKIIGASYWEPDGTPAPGTGSPQQRLREQDLDGIDAEVLFPPVFIGRFIENISDPAAYRAMVRAYNDFVAMDYCSVAPDRLLGAALIPITGLADALAELEYARQLSMPAVCLSHFPNGSLTPAAEDDAFWERALELDMPVTAHVTIGDRRHPMLVQSAAGRYEMPSTLLRGSLPPTVPMLAHMIASGVFDRIPDLRLYVAEAMAGWLPEVLYMMDDAYRTFKDHFDTDLKLLPSEYIRRHFYFGIVRDAVAIQCREHLPVENLMWGSDFPHSATSYPHSAQWLDETFADAPQQLRERILRETPCAYFRLDPTQPLTPTPAVAS
jgi:predicted TIM-barrel fold metal-dependent hydrolase